MDKKVTIYDIAKELNCSVTAVSFALNNKPGVSNALRAKILQYVEKMGYKPYIASRKDGMYDTSFPMIGIIYAGAGGHLVDEIQRGVDSVMRQSKFHQLRYTIDSIRDLNTESVKQVFFEEIISKGNIKGLIVSFLFLSDVIISKLFKHNIPIVLLNNKTDYGMSVYINNYQAVYDAVVNLIRLGHKNIGLITFDPNWEQVWMDRHNGYKDALKDNKIVYNPSYVAYLGGWTLKESQLTTQNLIKENQEITAFIYGSDLLAYGGMMGVRELKLRIPEDVCIIGFDDMEPNVAMIPPLSSIKQPMFEMGKKGTEMLLKAINSKTKLSHKTVKLDAQLILRESSNFIRK